MPPTLTLIAALSRNRAIGREGRLPWHLPADLKFFKQKTLDHTILLGRKTFDSIGRPLPRRRHIVITRDPAWQHEGVETAGSLDEALRLAGTDDPEIFVVGGGQIYTLALPRAHKIHLTQVDTHIPDADAFFPELNEREWRLIEETPRPADAENPLSMCFLTYERIAPAPLKPPATT